MSYWKEKVVELMEEGYGPGSPYEQMLKNGLPEELKAELGDDLEDYLIVRVAEAMQSANRMINEDGTDPQVAMELMKADLFAPIEM